MIMKLNVSNELKSRLMHAAENGSVIAKDILLEVKKNVPVEEIIRGTYNCFSTKRKRTEAGTFKKIRIVFTACSKDLAHPSFPDRNNPQAPWFPENRTDLEPSTFVELFRNLPKYSPDEINYFCSALSLDSKVTVRLHESMNDFMEAYLESNYSPISDSDTSSLHSSCMRYEDKARNAADFYTNFAGAKILVARDESNNILGRAVVWNEVTLWKSINTPIAASLLDRIYSSHAFVAELIRKQAQEAGILLRRRYNDYTHTTDFTVLNPIEGQEWAAGDNIQVSLTVKVPACRWHKKGVPYLDTFYSLHLTDGNLELRNTEGDTSIATCRSTEGRANRRKYVCPKCGKIHSFPDTAFCKNCQDMFYISTVFGKVLKGTSAEYKGKKYPSFLFKKGRPVPEFRRYLQSKYSINSLVYWVTYVHNVVYSFYRSMIYCYINSTQRCAGSIVIDIIPTNGADKRKFFPFAPYFPVTNVIKRYFYPYFPAIIGIKGYSFPYFPYLSGIMKIKTALYSLFSRLDWHKTVVFPCLGEIYEGIRSLSWEIPVT